jgi:ketosteroid isomerase-like protein
MDRDSVARWLVEYVDAWRSYDRARIGDLFTEDVSYRFYPHEDAIRGREAVVESWFREPDDPEGFTATYTPVAVDGEVAVAVGESVYTDPDGSVREAYDNCFVMRFAESGRCAEFTEFYVKRPTG